MLTWIAGSLSNSEQTVETERDLLKHLALVRFLAQRIHSRLPRNVDIDDLRSAGMIGLIEACRKFDPAKNIHFASFASFRIRGAILDSLRLLDWAPRALRHKGKTIQIAICSLTSRLGCAPSPELVAAELNTTLDDYQKVLGDLHGLQIGTLHRRSEDGSGEEEVVDVPGRPEDDPLFRCIRSETTEDLAAAIENLPDRERQVVTLYYYEELNLREIGLVLGMDANRVGYIRGSAVARLRAALSPLVPRAMPRALPSRSRRPVAASNTLQANVAA